MDRRGSCTHKLAGEQALGEGGDQDDLDEQANEGFDSRYRRLQITGLEDRREETAPVKCRHADDNGLIPRKRLAVRIAKREVGGSECADGQRPHAERRGLVITSPDADQSPGLASGAVWERC